MYSSLSLPVIAVKYLGGSSEPHRDTYGEIDGIEPLKGNEINDDKNSENCYNKEFEKSDKLYDASVSKHLTENDQGYVNEKGNADKNVQYRITDEEHQYRKHSQKNGLDKREDPVTD